MVVRELKGKRTFFFTVYIQHFSHLSPLRGICIMIQKACLFGVLNKQMYIIETCYRYTI